MSAIISVIIPVYNCEKYLKRCLDSVRFQTFSDFEVIIVNDGSTDESLHICLEYQKEDPRFVVYSQANKGQAAARNKGISVAMGQWVHFVDADDAIHPQMLELLFDAAVNTDSNISMCGFTAGSEFPPAFAHRSYQNSEYENRESTEQNILDLLQCGDKKYWVVWGKLIKKEIVEQNLFVEGKIYEDNAVICKWLYYAGAFVDIRHELYFYYLNPKSTTNKTFSEKHLDRLWALDEQAAFYRQIGYSRLWETLESRYVIAAANCFRGTDRKDLKKKIRKLYRKKICTRLGIIRLAKNERIFVADTFYSGIMRFYWAIKK